MIGGGVRVAALLLASTLSAIAWPHEVTMDRSKLPPCPRPPNYVHATELSKQAAVEIKASRFESANRLLKLAINILGAHYDPYIRVLDDTGQHLSAALFLEQDGKLAEAVHERQAILEDRLRMQTDPLLCNKVITRTAW